MDLKADTQATKEAVCILAFYAHDRQGALGLLERQLSALHMRAQMVLGFAAVALTTSGFSGRLIAGTSTAAQACIIVGLSVILTSCFFIFLKVLSVDWVISRQLRGDVQASLAAMIRCRDRKTRAYRIGSAGVFTGFVIFAMAIAIMLLNPEPLQVPVR